MCIIAVSFINNVSFTNFENNNALEKALVEVSEQLGIKNPNFLVLILDMQTNNPFRIFQKDQSINYTMDDLDHLKLKLDPYKATVLTRLLECSTSTLIKFSHIWAEQYSWTAIGEQSFEHFAHNVLSIDPLFIEYLYISSHYSVWRKNLGDYCALKGICLNLLESELVKVYTIATQDEEIVSRVLGSVPLSNLKEKLDKPSIDFYTI